MSECMNLLYVCPDVEATVATDSAASAVEKCPRSLR